MNIFRRALRRANLPLRYSEGFNPRPRISFADALPVGRESHSEWCEVELKEPYNPTQVLEALENKFPAGIEVMDVIRLAENLCRAIRGSKRI